VEEEPAVANFGNASLPAQTPFQPATDLE
jgi:hypothetical protein